jgi:hypothetical protein
MANTPGVSYLGDAATRRNKRPKPKTPPRDLTHADPVVAAEDRALVVEMIQAGFKKLASERHPDKHKGDPDATVAMQKLSRARDWGIQFVEHSPFFDWSW